MNAAAPSSLPERLRALLSELYPPRAPRGLWTTLIWMRLYAAAFPYPMPVRDRAEVDTVTAPQLWGFAPVYGMTHPLLYAERQGLAPLPCWVRDAL